MLKQSFFGLTTPWIKYENPSKIPIEPTLIPRPPRVTLLSNQSFERQDQLGINVGDTVNAGQQLDLHAGAGDPLLCTVSGTIAGIERYAGDFGTTYTAVTIDTDPVDTPDDAFAQACEAPSLENARRFLADVPGRLPFGALSDPERPINTIVINGLDRDLLVATQQYVVKARFLDLARGVDLLKEITGIEDIIVAVRRDTLQGYGHIAARVMAVGDDYPAAHPTLVTSALLGQVVPAGQTCEDLGICFVSAEAVASLASAYDSGTIPVDKVVTLIDKSGIQRLISARLGTPVKDVLSRYDITLEDRDRIIIGGPMQGSTVYSEMHPVLPDTDAIMVQGSNDIVLSSDYPCINCGECVRICPTQVPVSMLVRYLEAGMYQEAADEYDMYACIDCGLCSAVCTAKIPIFQYIKLGKYELGRIRAEEAADEAEAANEEEAANE